MPAAGGLRGSLQLWERSGLGVTRRARQNGTSIVVCFLPLCGGLYNFAFEDEKGGLASKLDPLVTGRSVLQVCGILCLATELW